MTAACMWLVTTRWRCCWLLFWFLTAAKGVLQCNKVTFLQSSQYAKQSRKVLYSSASSDPDHFVGSRGVIFIKVVFLLCKSVCGSQKPQQIYITGLNSNEYSYGIVIKIIYKEMKKISIKKNKLRLKTRIIQNDLDP